METNIYKHSRVFVLLHFGCKFSPSFVIVDSTELKSFGKLEGVHHDSQNSFLRDYPVRWGSDYISKRVTPKVKSIFIFSYKMKLYIIYLSNQRCM